MQKTKQFCFYCLHKLWIALAICLVVLATVVSVLRIALPYADNYKHHIEQVLTRQLGTEITIGQITAAWRQSGPALVLEQVELNAAEQLQLHIEQTSIRIDFWGSLTSRQLTAEHFELRGLRYWLDADALVQPGSKQVGSVSKVLLALEQLFFRQLKEFTLRDSQLILFSTDNPQLVLDISQLNWRNLQQHHQGHGELSIADVTANTVSFILDFQGPSLAESQGQLYLQSSELDLIPLFRQWLPQTHRLEKASINFEAWASLDNGQLHQIHVELADNSMHWQRAGTKHSLKLGPGQLLWQPVAEGWQLLSSELSLADELEVWPGLQFQLHKTSERWVAAIQQFQLDALEPLAQLWAEDSQVLQGILAYQPSGYLEQAHLAWQDTQWQLQGQFSGFSNLAVKDIPGTENLAGQFWAGNKFAWLALSAEEQQLTWDGLFKQAWPYQQLTADIRLLKRNNNWQLQIPTLQLQATDFSFDGQLALTLSEQPELALLAQVTGLDAANAHYYYPQRYMPEKTRDYLTNALNSGQVIQTTFLWQGAFADYPFREGQGHFQAFAELNEGVFYFAPNWPPLTELHGTLLFDNASMLIASHSANLAELALTEVVSATIPNLFDATSLDIRLNSQLDSRNITEVISQSSLKDNLGKTLAHLGLSGPQRVEMLLEIGLREPSVRVSGVTRLLNVQANLQAPALQINGLTGSIQFINEQISSDQLQFNWQGIQGAAELKGSLQEKGYKVDLAVNGLTPATDLTLPLWPEAADLLEGELDWQLKLALLLPSSGFTYQAELSARLDDLAVNLPTPFAKTQQQAASLQLVAHGNEQQSYFTLDYPALLNFQAELPHSTGVISRAQLSVGSADPGLGSKGFNVDINLPAVSLLPWYEFLQPLLSLKSEGQGLLPPLNKVRGRIGAIALPDNLQLTNTVFELSSTDQAWQLQLNGTELASRWQFFHDWQAQGIAAQFDYLHLAVPEKDAALAENERAVALLAELPEQQWLTQMVPLQLSCQDCSIGHYRFGNVQVQAAGTGDTWQLRQFDANYKGSKLGVSGYWQPDNAAGVSHFNGSFSSPNIGNLLAEYQLSTAISGSRSDISFELNWQGAPQQFRLGSLNGNVKFALGDGALTEVSDQGARLFSLFSLDSLVRKLRLDFRDVFAKGFYYNKMSGTLNVQRGIAQTNDFVVDGVPGNLAIQGYSDLVKRQMDYQMSFAPKVTSSLPVIIAWMVNPATGLAALALDEVFQSAEVISRINFTVTGSFDKPVVTEVNRHSTEVPVPVRIAQPEAVPLDNTQPRSD
ncbi:MAG: TIGR02099 family protein [Alishewanella sp.]|nr:TIGR02099 family protein [Alishewanella sp.]